MHTKNEFDQMVGFQIENWQGVKIPPKTTMLGRYCFLEPLNLTKHAPKLFDALQLDNKGESWTYLPYGPFNKYQEFHAWLINNALFDDPLFYVIVDLKTQLPLGLASYLRINPEHGVIEVGHLHFSALLKKTPAATEAMYLMMYRAFEELGYRRYEWKCDSLNQPSRAAAERLGFKFEGIFRQDKVYKNRNRDTAWFSIIDNEWLEIKARLQKWLDPHNFDEDGKQKLALRNI